MKRRDFFKALAIVPVAAKAVKDKAASHTTEWMVGDMEEYAVFDRPLTVKEIEHLSMHGWVRVTSTKDGTHIVKVDG